MSVKLTETERRVAELYMAGVKPRDIANRLGISINTVYKALSKARKAIPAIDDRERQLAEGSRHEAFVYTYTLSVSSYVYQSWPVTATSQGRHQINEDVVIKKLDEILAILKSGFPRQERPRESVREPPAPPERDGGNGHIPESLKKNVWISLLRSKAI